MQTSPRIFRDHELHWHGFCNIAGFRQLNEGFGDGLGGAAPGAIPTNAVITAVNIPRKYRPPSIPKVGSCSRSTARRDFQLAKEANEARAFEVPTWHEHELDASWAVSLDN